MDRETSIIERIRQRIPSRSRRYGRLLVGIGDDAAVIRVSRHAELVVSCDQFLENVHFLGRVHPPEAIGYKALARATSDLAAMGATPRLFLLSLALPVRRTGDWLIGFASGMAQAARRFGLTLAGGDLAQHPAVAISITVLGEIEPGRAIQRAGARPGDLICVSGRLGAAQLGLQLVLRRLPRDSRWQKLLNPHLRPPLRLDLGRWLARRRIASAMMDISDGLSTDLARLCRASGVGARVWAERVPAVRVPDSLRKLGAAFDPLALALHGGEDYELLFTLPRRLRKRLPRSFAGVRITEIGEIVRGKAMHLVGSDGRATKLESRGWDHFHPSSSV